MATATFEKDGSGNFKGEVRVLFSQADMDEVSLAHETELVRDEQGKVIGGQDRAKAQAARAIMRILRASVWDASVLMQKYDRDFDAEMQKLAQERDTERPDFGTIA